MGPSRIDIFLNQRTSYANDDIPIFRVVTQKLQVSILKALDWILLMPLMASWGHLPKRHSGVQSDLPKKWQ
jgi:hypothetical protein